ncbi:CoA-transferase [Paenibacillus sinopodophylli]|uniref:CoA-transferase n=1 Tax=Paenibacillus sinopodophylli TaxID=1837342 RepID=UPI0014869FAE|nr:CoA-transferase [Paenibacillus sinopodophylli]
MPFSADELLICTLARRIRDGETVAVGNNSPIPAAAALLARESHAPRACIYIIGQADWPFEGTKEFFDFLQRGGVDVFFLSGAQIDAYGSLNLHVIGDYNLPKVRMPGGAGSAVVSFVCRRLFLFKTDHTRKGFTEKLDFISSTSRSEANVYRIGELEGVFTPIAVLEPTGESGRLQLAQVSPGISVDSVKEHTGFRLETQQKLKQMTEPSDEELHILRSSVKKLLYKIYPQFVISLWGKQDSDAADQEV